MNRILLAILLLMASIYGAFAQFNGCPPGLCGGGGGIGSAGGGFNRGGAVVNNDCANPTNGQIDLSVCSNAIYVSLVL